MAACSHELTSLGPEPTSHVQEQAFDVDVFLADERCKDLLRFSTAGSVDDGKSTLIGRLLYDTQSVYEDQVRAIAGKGSAGAGQLDLALLTDGLRAEREQGITIDVAYRYFATARRKFIIADTPGHEQYTRNMATGASTADVAIVLVDARKGLLLQSRRHAYIAALLGVPHVIVAINKMDLVEYSEATYVRILQDFADFFAGLDEYGGATLHFVPVSALSGDNVVRPTDHMSWYSGPTLLAILENIPSTRQLDASSFRFPVQRVLRPNPSFRGFAGQISAGTVRVGDEILILPSARRSRVRSIVTFDGNLAEASAPLSVCLTLEDELDISRGDVFVAPEAPATIARRFSASLVWMDAQPLSIGRRYLLKHCSRTLPATVTSIRYSLDVANLVRSTAVTLTANGIGLVDIETQQPLPLDLYTENRYTGSFVLIDPETNATVAAGMVREILHRLDAAPNTGPVTPLERVQRWGYTGAHLVLTGPPAFATAVERALLSRGAVVFHCPVAEVALQELIVAGGGIALTLLHAPAPQAQARIGENVTAPVADDEQWLSTATRAALELLRATNVLQLPHSSTSGDIQ